MVLDVLDLYPDLGGSVKRRFDDLVSKANERNLTAPESREIEKVMEEMAQAYTNITGGSYDQIMGDASKIMDPLEKEDCEHSRQLARNYYAIVLENLKPLIATGKGEKGFNATMKAIKETENLYNYAYSFICSHVGQQLKALEYYGLDTQPLFLKAEEKAAQWYDKPQDWDPQQGNNAHLLPEVGNGLFPKITLKEVEKILYPIDKIDHEAWNNLVTADKYGQLKFGFNVAKHGSGKEALVWYSINFDALEEVKISKQLTPFDKRVYIAASAIYKAGNSVFTATQIYYNMGNTKRPSQAALQKINDSLTKMSLARIYISNAKDPADTFSSESSANSEVETYTSGGTIWGLRSAPASIPAG